jgi:hypothetical protein
MLDKLLIWNIVSDFFIIITEFLLKKYHIFPRIRQECSRNLSPEKFGGGGGVTL